MTVRCLHEQNTGAEVTGCKKNIRFKLCRRRFPAKIAFAVKINAEGQTLEPVAIYLPSHGFPHVQVVAFSRSSLFEDVTFPIV
jgi:hypothetical protein